MSNFSVVIITLNEEKNIGRCIESASLVSDDIVIIDAMSTDKTVQIAKSRGARVVVKKWEGYSENKNVGAELAKNDWIISIDADEVISDELARSILNIEKNENTIYQINRLNNFLGKWVKHSGWYPSWKKRIYNKNKYHWNEAAVHEDLVGHSPMKLKKIKGRLLHYSYQSQMDVDLKIDRYSKLLAKDIIKNKKHIRGVKRFFGPTYKFINTFIFKFGFLDGITGYKISKMNAKVVREKIKQYDILKNTIKNTQ